MTPDGNVGPMATSANAKKRIQRLWPVLCNEWLCELPDYKTCIECLQADVVVGPHLNRLVGTSISAVHIEPNTIIMPLIKTMLDEEGRLAFFDERFRNKLNELANIFDADRITSRMVAPLPYLVVPAFPLQLNNELVLDRLTDEEVTRCYQAGVIRPNFLRFPLIEKDVVANYMRIGTIRQSL
jgi:hypothetical protein